MTVLVAPGPAVMGMLVIMMTMIMIMTMHGRFARAGLPRASRRP